MYEYICNNYYNDWFETYDENKLFDYNWSNVINNYVYHKGIYYKVNKDIDYFNIFIKPVYFEYDENRILANLCLEYENNSSVLSPNSVDNMTHVSSNKYLDIVYDVKDITEEDKLYIKYDSTAEYNVQTELLQNVIENSNVTKYEEGLYDKFKEQVQAEYEASKEMFGFETVEEDIEDEILYYIYETVVVQQIANEESLSISDEEYKEGLNTYAINAEYESADSYEQEMGADNIRFWLLEDKVMKFLADNAKITEVEGQSLSEQQGFDGGEEEIEGIDETEIEDLGLSDEEIIIDGTEE